jgi:HSP20 family protein
MMTNLIPWTKNTIETVRQDLENMFERCTGQRLPGETVRQDLENMFERYTGERLAGNGETMKTWMPRIDVEETDKEITVKADLPGVDPNAVEITVTGNILTVAGEKKEEKEENKKNFHRLERFEGKFYRQIALPAGADADKVNATSANGVITITIPKKPELQPKKINVKVS